MTSREYKYLKGGNRMLFLGGEPLDATSPITPMKYWQPKIYKSMDQSNEEMPDQSALLTCLWDVLPDSWKSKGFHIPPKMAIMLPGDTWNDEILTPPVDFNLPKSIEK